MGEDPYVLTLNLVSKRLPLSGMCNESDSPYQVAVGRGIVRIVWISCDEMHRSGGARTSSSPEVTDLNRAISLNDGDSEGCTSSQKQRADSELHIGLIERYLIY